MNGKVQLSIIITVFNQQQFLKRALQSCLQQQLNHAELLVIDDGSEPAIVLPELEQCGGTKIRLLRQPNSGVAAARNLGITQATGTFLKFLDSDDELLPGCCQSQLDSLSEQQARLSIIGYRVQQGDKWVEGIPKFDSLLSGLLQGNVAPLHAFLYRAGDVRAIGGFDRSERTLAAMEDYDLNLRLALAGVKAVTVHQVGVLYHRQVQSRSSDTRKVHQANIRILKHAVAQIQLGQNGDISGVELLQGVIQLAVQGQDYQSFVPLLSELVMPATEASTLSWHQLQRQTASRLHDISNPEQLQFWQQVMRLLSVAPLQKHQVLSQPGYWFRPAAPALAAHFFDGVMLAQALSTAQQSRGLWLWGTGVWADYWLQMLLAFNVRPLGFIDSYAEADAQHQGLRCMKLEQIPVEQLHHVIICSRDSYLTIADLLVQRGMADRILHYVTL